MAIFWFTKHQPVVDVAVFIAKSKRSLWNQRHEWRNHFTLGSFSWQQVNNWSKNCVFKGQLPSRLRADFVRFLSDRICSRKLGRNTQVKQGIYDVLIWWSMGFFLDRLEETNFTVMYHNGSYQKKWECKPVDFPKRCQPNNWLVSTYSLLRPFSYDKPHNWWTK